MAGGLGKRLRPLTDEMPKPLLSVGNKPLLQNILESFVRQHFSHFFISVGKQNFMFSMRSSRSPGRWNICSGIFVTKKKHARKPKKKNLALTRETIFL